MVESGMHSHPLFSVIVPTYKRPRLLTACVASVLSQTFPAGRYEIIVVADGGRALSNRTARALAPHVAGGRILLLQQRRRLGWAAARLLGARHSRGEILAFLDDDCVAPPHWLACCARAYAAHPEVDGVAGGLRPGARMNVAGRKQYAGHMAYFDRLNEPLGTRVDRAGRAWFSFGGNRTFRREVWLAAQPDKPLWYYDDYTIDLRLYERDAYIYYEPAAWVTHHYVLGVAQRMRAAYRYGRSEARMALPPSIHENIAATPLAKWRRLKTEVPEASTLARAWYSVTQPLTWIARRAGHIMPQTARGKPE
jgi:glycosyltransferase involved in cell wall biosynthesis